jgi:hypothetical protein
MGTHYYGILVPVPAALPTGGTTGQVLAKSSSANYDVTWVTLSSGVTIGTTTIATGGTSLTLAGITSLALTTSGVFSWGTNTFLSSPAANVFQLGPADTGFPNSQQLQVQNVTAGTTDGAGQTFYIDGSVGTGLGVGGDIVFGVSLPALSTGSGQNSIVTAVLISGTSGATQLVKTVRNKAPTGQTLFPEQGGTHWDDTGAVSGPTQFFLPTAAPGIKYEFTTTNTGGVQMEIIAAASNTISVGGMTSATAGNVTTTTAYSHLALEAISATEWVATALTGNWSVT